MIPPEEREAGLHAGLASIPIRPTAYYPLGKSTSEMQRVLRFASGEGVVFNTKARHAQSRAARLHAVACGYAGLHSRLRAVTFGGMRWQSRIHAVTRGCPLGTLPGDALRYMRLHAAAH